MIGPPTEEEYAVYSRVCEMDIFLFTNEGCVFLNQTEPPILPMPSEFRPGDFDNAPSIFQSHPEILTDFNAKNAHSWPLERRFKTPAADYYLLPADEICVRFPIHVDLMTVKYRCIAYFIFSRVGFSRDGTYAYVHIEYTGCMAYNILLEKQPCGWDVVQDKMSWCT